MTPIFSQNFIALKDAFINPLKGYLGEYEMRGTLVDHSTFVADDRDGDMQFNVSSAWKGFFRTLPFPCCP